MSRDMGAALSLHPGFPGAAGCHPYLQPTKTMSLHDKSLLVSLTLSGIASTRADKAITREVLLDQQAAADAGRWLARLWPKEAMEAIRALDGQIRAFHYDKTLPWLDKGERIIAARTFSAYMDTMRGYRQQRDQAVQAFLDRYDDWIDAARTMRGSGFREAEYPPKWKAGKRFAMEIASQPVPHRDDFRIRLAETDLDTIQDELEARVERAAKTAEEELFRRMAAPVSHLVERLADPDAKFTEASFNALREVVDALPDLNIFEDPLVEELRERIRTQLCRLDPAGLAGSKSDRSRAMAKANDILSKMAPWMDRVEIEEDQAA